MLDIKFIRENREIVELAIQNKKVKGEVNLDKLFELADQRNKFPLSYGKIDVMKRFYRFPIFQGIRFAYIFKFQKRFHVITRRSILPLCSEGCDPKR